MLSALEPLYRVWGGFGGDGLVVRSPEPLDIYPIGRTVNVIPVADLRDAMRYVNVSTATAGVYPASRKPELRDLLGRAGAQRLVTLGGLHSHSSLGRPHDGFYPLHRLVRWLVDED